MLRKGIRIEMLKGTGKKPDKGLEIISFLNNLRGKPSIADDWCDCVRCGGATRSMEESTLVKLERF